MKFIVERQSLEVVLTKVRAAWKDAPGDSLQSRVLVEAKERLLRVTASNGILTQAAECPLFEKAVGEAQFLISGPELSEIVGATGEPSLTFEYDNGVVELKAGRGSWRLVEDVRNLPNFKIGDLIVKPGEQPAVIADKISRDILLKAMKVVENAFDPNTEIRTMRGVRFNPLWIGASTGMVTIVQRWTNMVSQDFWLRSTEFKALKEMLNLFGEEFILVHYNSGTNGATRIQFDMGPDRMVCNAMEFTTKDTHDYEKGLMTQTKKFDVVFDVDKRSFLDAVKQANIFSQDGMKIKMSREVANLLIESEDERGNQASVVLPVSFGTNAPTDFNTELNWKILKDSVEALSREVVKFGQGKVGAVSFIRFDEEVMSVVAFERKSAKAAPAKKTSKAAEAAPLGDEEEEAS